MTEKTLRNKKNGMLVLILVLAMYVIAVAGLVLVPMMSYQSYMGFYYGPSIFQKLIMFLCIVWILGDGLFCWVSRLSNHRKLSYLRSLANTRVLLEKKAFTG